MNTVKENEVLYRRLLFKMTRDALRQEAACEHSTVVYRQGKAGDVFGSTKTICICFYCRMEWQMPWHVRPRELETLQRRYVTPNVVGATHVTALRAYDLRHIITDVDLWSGEPPTRKRRKRK